MSFPSTQFATSRRMGIYEPNHQISMWGHAFKSDNSPNTGISTIVEADGKLDNGSEGASDGTLGTPKRIDQEARKPNDKISRRLAQNREAARKSRLRKKAYVQQLESSRMKLAQLEQELKHVRQQGIYLGDSSHLALPGSVSSGVDAFEIEYGHWVEEQNRQICELRNAMQTHITDYELRKLVDNSMSHYDNLFHMKIIAAKSDVFYLMSGLWKTPAERFFLWIGGFRPSELLKVLSPQLEPLTDQQSFDVRNLQKSSLQAEDALSQGMEKLQHTLAETLVSESLGNSGVADYMEQMAEAMEKLKALEGFVNQADHLRQQALQQMYRILTIRQAARGLLVLSDYIHRLQALSSLWAARPREPA